MSEITTEELIEMLNRHIKRSAGGSDMNYIEMVQLRDHINQMQPSFGAMAGIEDPEKWVKDTAAVRGLLLDIAEYSIKYECGCFRRCYCFRGKLWRFAKRAKRLALFPKGSET